MKNEKTPSLVLNYIYNLIYEILILIIPFVTATYTARIFGADGIGIYSFSINLAAYAILIGSLGVSSYGQREISRYRDEKYEQSKIFFELIVLKTITMIISLSLYLFPVYISNKYSPYLSVLILYVLSGIFDISWFFRGIEDFKTVSLIQILIKVLSVVCLFSFVKEKSDLLLYIFIISISTLLGNILMWITIPKNVCKVRIKEIKPFRHLKGTLIYFIPTIATSVYTQLDKLMIGWITNDDFETGYYEQASKIINMCKGVVLTINVVMSSRISYLFQIKDYEQIKKRIQRTSNFILFLSIPICFGLIAIADVFVPIFFGDGYEKVVSLIYILSPMIIIVGISNVLGSCYFTPSGQRAKSNKVIIGGALLNLALNLILIYTFKSIGACIASLCAETFIAIVYLSLGRKWLSLFDIIISSWKKIISSMLMFLTIIVIKHFFQNSIIILFLEIISGAFVYFAVEFMLFDEIVITSMKKYGGKIWKKKKNL